MESKTEDLIIKDNGRDISVTKTTWVDENGKEYTKEVFHGNDGDIINLKESNMPLYDYESIEVKKDKDGSEYYVAYSKDFSTDGQQDKSEFKASKGVVIPNGYVVAKDRSEGKNGKLIIVPEDNSLLPDGAEVKSDGRGGWILTAPESAYKENGNLNLKPDPTLEKTIEFYDDYREFNYDYVSSRTGVWEYQTQKNGNTYFGRSRPISDETFVYYKYATINDKTKELENYETLGDTQVGDIYVGDTPVIGFGGKIDEKASTERQAEVKAEKQKEKQELLNKISGYGK